MYIFHCIIIVAMLLISSVASAQTYELPNGPLPSGCTASGSQVDCSGDVDVGDGESVAVTEPVDWNIRGDLGVGDDASVNEGGNAGDLNIGVDGAIDVGDEANVTGFIASGGPIDTGDQSTVIGNIDADGDVTSGDGSTIDGTINSDGAVDTGDDATVAGTVTAAGAVTTGDGSSLGGGIDSGGDVDTGDSSSVGGDIEASGDVNTGDDSLVSGNVTSGGSVDTGESSTVDGDILADGDVTVGDGGIVNGCISAGGSIDASDGSVDCQTDIKLLSNSKTITIGETLKLGVAAQNCQSGTSGDPDFWRSTWSDADGIGLPNSGAGTPTEESPCDDQRSRQFQPTQPGTYEIEFISEWCDKPGSGQGGGGCENNFDKFAEEFGSDQITIEVGPLLPCTNIPFSSSLGSNWDTGNENGFNTSFGDPEVVNRDDGQSVLRMTNEENNLSTRASYLNKIPWANNRVEVTFKHYAYGTKGQWDDADGIAVVFSNASAPLEVGGTGGSLGYAQKGRLLACWKDGFTGGWLGIGLDEYGNYSDDDECREGGPGEIPQAVAVRGNGRGTDGYEYIVGTESLTPPISNPTSPNPAPGHRYKIIVDTRANNGVPEDWLMRVLRDTGTGFTELLRTDLKGVQSSPPPEEVYLSFTGSTGEETNIHEIDNLEICAYKGIKPVEDIDHFTIDIGSDPASTCFPNLITITAKNANNEKITDYNGTIDIFTSSGHGTWSDNSTVNSVTNNKIDDGEATYNFSEKDNGDINLNLSNQHADDLFIKVEDNNAHVSSNSDNFSFRYNTFVIKPINTYENKNNTDWVAGMDQDCKITLWRQDPPDPTGKCKIANNYNKASEKIQMWIDRHVDDPDGESPDASSADTGDSIVLNSTESTANTIELDFSDNTLDQAGSSSFTLETTDVGKFSIQAKETSFAVNASDPSTSENRTIYGGSSTNVVRPFGFDIDFHDDRADNPDNCGIQTSCAQNVSGDVFTRAGADFSTTITAVLWQSADDVNDDGRPDSGANLGDNSATPSFGQEEDGEQESVNTIRHLVAPSDGDNGTLTDSLFDAPEFSNGSATHTLSWSEVGIIDLNATLSDGSYMVSGPQVRGKAPNAGRFIPDHFQLSFNAPFFKSYCNDFTYLDQPFYYSFAPVVTLTALNAKNATTQNYGNNFWRFDEAKDDYLANRVYQDQANATASFSAIKLDDANATGHSNFDGEWKFSLHDYYNSTTNGDKFRYQKNGTEDPFNATVDLTLNKADLTDQDDVCYEINGTCANYAMENITGTELRYGRMIVENAYGSDLRPLDNIGVRAEYYDGSAFTTNQNDTCTAYNATDIDWSSATYSEQGNLTSSDLGSSGDGTLQDGEGSFSIHKEGDPDDGPGKTGYVDYRFPMPTWLHYDWNDNGTRSDPPARATFGIYKGSENIIYQQETTWK